MHDFSETHYAELLELAAARFRFMRYTEADGAAGGALWRHDIDFSPQRALALARIEAHKGLYATYFIQLSSRYYNPFEKEVTQCLREIADLGHGLGVHFDPDYRGGTPVETRLRLEAEVLMELTGVPIAAFSLHNPTTFDNSPFEAAQIAGLINASTSALRQQYVYCSDSNGIWRYRPLQQVLTDPATANVHVLTHPEWWVQEPLSPRQRIQRCIDGRAAFCQQHYDELLQTNGRPNVGHPHD